jgi:hypothetical protein
VEGIAYTYTVRNRVEHSTAAAHEGRRQWVDNRRSLISGEVVRGNVRFRAARATPIDDIERCRRCAGRLKVMAAIVDPQVIVRTHTHRGLPARETVGFQQLTRLTPQRHRASVLFHERQFQLSLRYS